MNFSKFFIDRPIFAGVLSLLILIAGLIALRALPIAEYPEVVPPVAPVEPPGPPLSSPGRLVLVVLVEVVVVLACSVVVVAGASVVPTEATSVDLPDRLRA